jgi:hypothetical protein
MISLFNIFMFVYNRTNVYLLYTYVLKTFHAFFRNDGKPALTEGFQVELVIGCVDESETLLS